MKPEPTETFTLSRTTFNYVVVGFVFLIVGLIAGGLLFGRGLTRAEVVQIVRSAGAGTTANPQQAEIAVLADDDPSLGPDDAPVTLVEFSDYNCPHCTYHATNTFRQLVAHYGDNLRIVYRDFPVVGYQLSEGTAQAANCANEQGKFWDFHTLLFDYSEARSRDAYIGFASEVELDTGAFAVCLDTQRYASEVNLDKVDALNLGLRATPSFYINYVQVQGAQSFALFADVIDRELRRAGIEPPARDTNAES